MRRCGKDFRVYAFTGSPATWKLVGSKSDAVSITSETISVTDKDQAAWQASLDGCGIVSASVTIQGVVSDSAVFRELQQLAFLRQSVALKLVSGPSSEVWLIIHGRLEKIERTGTFNDAEGFSLFLSGNGAPGTTVRIAAVAPMPFASLTALCKTPIQVAAVAPMPFASFTAKVYSWHLVFPQGSPSPLGVSYGNLAMNQDGTVLYAHMLGSGSKLYRSNDYGVSWTDKTSPAAYFEQIQCDETGEILVCTNGNEIYRSINGGASWSAISPSPSDPAWSLSLSRDGAVLYACIGQNVQKYAGGSWTNLSRPASTGTNRLIIATNYDGTVLYAGTYSAYPSFGELAGVWEYSGGWSRVYAYPYDALQTQRMVTANGEAIARVTTLKAVVRRGGSWGTDPLFPVAGGPNYLAISNDGTIQLHGPKQFNAGTGVWDYIGPPGKEANPWTDIVCASDGVMKLASTALIGMTNRSELWFYGPT